MEKSRSPVNTFQYVSDTSHVPSALYPYSDDATLVVTSDTVTLIVSV